MTRGRPTKLTQERTEKIVEALRRGTSIESVSALVGISRQSFYNWVKPDIRAREQGEATGDPIPKEDRLYVALATGVEQAITEWEQRQLETIEGHSKKEWTAAAWLLERRYPHKYGRRDRVDIRRELEIEVKGHTLKAIDVPADEIPYELEDGSKDASRALPPGRGNGSESAGQDPRRLVIARLVRDSFTPEEADAHISTIMNAEQTPASSASRAAPSRVRACYRWRCRA